MSDLRINNITNSGGNGGPVVAGVSTVSTSAFMVIPSGNTEVRSAGSGRGIMAGGANLSPALIRFLIECNILRFQQQETQQILVIYH